MSNHQISSGADYAPTAQAEKVVGPGAFVFAAAYLDHGHIYGQTNGLKDSGATLKWVFDPDPAKVSAFVERNPEAQVAESYGQILADPDVRLVAAAAVPCQRADIGFQAMEAGKDYFTDKAPFTTLEQLAAARR
ncbi:Gfo/Idh/MocA family oxidoreductase, partial [Pontiella sp.]|uniref:Gfo/Idh/MocA family oxidoreductase n=1 Tax=Pontiella sp. TaxID=2837462 RepID=UPI00356B24DB